MTVPEMNSSVKVQIGDITAEIPEGISEQMMTSLIRGNNYVAAHGSIATNRYALYSLPITES